MGSSATKSTVTPTGYRKTDTQTTSGTDDSASNSGEHNETTKEQNEENDAIDRNGNVDIENDNVNNEDDKDKYHNGDNHNEANKHEKPDAGDEKLNETSGEGAIKHHDREENDNVRNVDVKSDDGGGENFGEGGDNGETNNNNGEDLEPLEHAVGPSSETSDNLKDESDIKEDDETSGEKETATENGDKHYDGSTYERILRNGETINSNTHGNGHEKQTLYEKSDAIGDDDGPDKAGDKKTSERAVLFSVRKGTDAVTDTNDTVVNDNDNSHDQNERETSSAKQRKEAANKDAKLKATEQKSDPEKSNKPEKKIIDNGLNDNLDFYRDKIKSKPPPGYKISEMLKWKGDYKGLESRHTYIQWLFPIPEGSGMNSSAQALQEHEAEAIREDKQLKKRVLQAFEMMLDFYGMKLHNKYKGQFEREFNWKERYEHLNKSSHNYLRITRILKCLGEVGYEHLQAPWVEFLMDEAEDEKALPRLTTSSAIEYWIHAIKDEEKQIEYLQRHEQIKAGSTATKAADKSKPNSIPTKPTKTDPPSTGASKPPAAKSGPATDKPQTNNTPNKNKTDASNVPLKQPPTKTGSHNNDVRPDAIKILQDI